MRKRRKSLKFKLKGICTKIRFWLIKKLGGCTVETIDVRQGLDNNVELIAEEFVPYDNLFGNPTFARRHIFNNAAAQIARNIFEKGLYELLIHDDYKREGRVFRTRVRIVPPADRPVMDELDFYGGVSDE